MARSRDPLVNRFFIVSIDGFTDVFGFTEVDGLEQETNSISYREGGDLDVPRQIPGGTTFSDLVLKRGVYAGNGSTGVFDMELWAKSVFDIGKGLTQNNDVADGVLNTTNGSDNFRRNVTIKVQDKSRKTIRIYKARYAWPKNFKSDSLNANDEGTVFVNEITLAHEGLEIINI